MSSERRRGRPAPCAWEAAPAAATTWPRSVTRATQEGSGAGAEGPISQRLVGPRTNRVPGHRGRLLFPGSSVTPAGRTHRETPRLPRAARTWVCAGTVPLRAGTSYDVDPRGPAPIRQVFRRAGRTRGCDGRHPWPSGPSRTVTWRGPSLPTRRPCPRRRRRTPPLHLHGTGSRMTHEQTGRGSPGYTETERSKISHCETEILKSQVFCKGGGPTELGSIADCPTCPPARSSGQAPYKDRVGNPTQHNSVQTSLPHRRLAQDRTNRLAAYSSVKRPEEPNTCIWPDILVHQNILQLKEVQLFSHFKMLICKTW